MFTLYKNKQGEVFGLSPLDIDNNRHIGLTKLTDEEVEAHLNPIKTDEEKKAIRVSEIDIRLGEIDTLAIRPTRAIKVADLQGEEPNEFDVNRLIELELESQNLRAERKSLNV